MWDGEISSVGFISLEDLISTIKKHKFNYKKIPFKWNRVNTSVDCSKIEETAKYMSRKCKL